MNIKRNLGRINLSTEFIEEDPELISRVFNEILFLPLQIREHYDTDVLEYIGYSPRFDKLMRGAMAPIYNLIIDDKYDLKVGVERA